MLQCLFRIESELKFREGPITVLSKMTRFQLFLTSTLIQSAEK